MRCRGCGRQIDDNARICPYCKARVRTRADDKTSRESRRSPKKIRSRRKADEQRVPWYQTTAARITMAIVGVILMVSGIGTVVRGLTSAHGPGPAHGRSIFDGNVTVTFDGNGADAGTMEPVEVAPSEAFTIPACGFTRTGYLFSHWTTNLHESRHATAYAPGDAYLTQTDVCLFANWVKAAPIVRLSAETEGDTLVGEVRNWQKGDNHAVLVITNKSDATIDLAATFSYADNTGGKKGDTHDDAVAVPPSGTVVLVGYDLYESHAVSYSIACSTTLDWMIPLEDEVTFEKVSCDADEAVVRVRNAGPHPATINSARCLFEDKNTTYVGDAHSFVQLEPGEEQELAFERNGMYDYRPDASVVPPLDQLERSYVLNGYCSKSEG